MAELVQFLLHIWQLPQNLLGILIVLITDARHAQLLDYWWTDKFSFGVSLGEYIIFGFKGNGIKVETLHHEQGHQKQSKYLGWFYLLIIGLPSLLGNIYDRIAHKNWNYRDRIKWYYNQPWEKWADKLGGVNRWQNLNKSL